MSDKVDWRSIRCADVQWDAAPGVSHRVIWNLYRISKEPPSFNKDRASWHDKTLGDVAAMGERRWRREVENCGEKTMEAIRLTIDYVAAGHSVTEKIDAYTPRPWSGERQ